jgi:uncharacterized membrane protein HdeD (DUF308 family)
MAPSKVLLHAAFFFFFFLGANLIKYLFYLFFCFSNVRGILQI